LGGLENKGKFLVDRTAQNSSERIAISVINTGFFALIGSDWDDKTVVLGGVKIRH
jgi:hypothetical protein